MPLSLSPRIYDKNRRLEYKFEVADSREKSFSTESVVSGRSDILPNRVPLAFPQPMM